MHTNWCVLIEISMEIGMINFLIGIIGHCTCQRNLIFRTYCSNILIYTVLNLTDLRIKMDSKRIPLYPFFKIVVSILSEIEKKEKICGHFPFPPFKIRLDQGSSEMSRLSSIWGWVCENRLWSCKFNKIQTLL